MKSQLTPVLCLLAIACCLWLPGCSLFPLGAEVPDSSENQAEQASSAIRNLNKLQDIDTLVRVDNDWLSGQIRDGIQAQAERSGQYHFKNIDIDYSKQYIKIESIVDIYDEDKNTIQASVSGEILLDMDASGIEWTTNFTQLTIDSAEFTFRSRHYTDATTELHQLILHELRTDIAAPLIQNDINRIDMDIVPLAQVEVGASLPGFSSSPARRTEPLKGVFLVANSAMLIDHSTTTFALDMTYIPKLSFCAAGVSVSRAMFSSDIRSREPVGIVDKLEKPEDVRYFFSEISAAKRPLTIIHYWFADGKPLALEELPVKPSARWRTWSSRGTSTPDAGRWEVLVVEKQSECVLLSRSIRKPGVRAGEAVNRAAWDRQVFRDYKDAFEARTADFSIVENRPKVALIEVTRDFFRSALNASVKDLDIDANFDKTALPVMRFSARLPAFETTDIICQKRQCPEAVACKINVSHCKRLRDSRDCSSCLFRNPLNNRCVSEATDPLCEASRERQNVRYNAERESCLSRAESAKTECDRLNLQASRSCQIESGFEDSVCESVKSSLENPGSFSSLATIAATTQASGELSASFSNFRIDGDLDSLTLDLSLKSDLSLEGDLVFSPSSSNGPLAACIEDWQGSFHSSFANTPTVNNLSSPLEEEQNTLEAKWSGFGLNIKTVPSPLESLLGENPQLLAACRIGLTVDKVQRSLRDDESGFFQGDFELKIQPLATRIELAPAALRLANKEYLAAAKLSARSIRYSFEN